MRNQFSYSSILFVAFFVLFSSCSQKPVVNIGIIGPLQTSHGKTIWQAFEMAAEEINLQGGILNKTINLIPIDDENNIHTGIQRLEQELKNKKIDFLAGGMASGIVLRQMEIMANKKILWLGVGGAHSDIIKKIEKNYPRYKYYFRVGTADSIEQAKAIAQMSFMEMKQKRGLIKFALISTELEWGKQVSKQTKEFLIELGFQNTYEKYFPAETTNFTNILNNCINSKADFIVAYTLGEEGIILARQYKDLLVPLPVIGNNAISSREEWKEETNGKGAYWGYCFLGGGPAAITSKTLHFLHKYKNKYHKTPGFLSWPSYDALYILKAAAEKNSTLNTDSLISTLETIEYEGNVNYKFSKNHDLTYGTVNGKHFTVPIFFQWKKNGMIYPVWPPKFAQTEFEIPDWIIQKNKEMKNE